MSRENPLWGAPRIHGELLKLGFDLAESTVSKYMIRRGNPPSQNRCDRSVPGSNRALRAPICFRHYRPRTASALVVCGDPASDGGVASATDCRGLPVGDGTDLSGARQ